ncbi:hypothetical protein B8W67_00995 [Mycolicibacillus koreensis]|uniref:Uncharacterized protein n=1 Tax=Mycolicibacillus koreensis TaxID=1069220 RepID=A0AA91STF2_9MYCO|nr:hypothetical protein B8W67_00995 [Mycolicibacillus koreensis]
MDKLRATVAEYPDVIELRVRLIGLLVAGGHHADALVQAGEAVTMSPACSATAANSVSSRGSSGSEVSAARSAASASASWPNSASSCARSMTASTSGSLIDGYLCSRSR